MSQVSAPGRLSQQLCHSPRTQGGHHAEALPNQSCVCVTNSLHARQLGLLQFLQLLLRSQPSLDRLSASRQASLYALYYAIIPPCSKQWARLLQVILPVD